MSERWTEADAHAFIDRGAVFVPARMEQIATLVGLIPAAPDETFALVELGAGEGVLARAVLEAFPACRYLALDGSATMRASLMTILAPFKPRAEVRAFELADAGWREALPSPLRCVLASLVVHHLPPEGKRRLFADLAKRLIPGGALLLADVVEPVDERARTVYARQWDEAARAQSLGLTGGPQAFEEFQRDRWNFYRDPNPDPYDQPSPLADQLMWLREAGLTRVDCFWLHAGHAIYGGYR